MNNSSSNPFAIIVGEMALATGITGLVCCPFLILMSAVETVYICRYKTTFLQRLFFYLTIAATIAEGASVPLLSYGNAHEATVFLAIIISVFPYILIVELFIVGSINVTLLSKMYKYRVSARRQSLQFNAEYMLCCCLHTRAREAALVLVIFGAPLFALVIEVVVILLKPFVALYIFLPFVYIPAIADLVLCLISTVILCVWFCALRKNRLLRGKAKLMCKQTILITGILVVYFVPWMLFPIAILLALQLPSFVVAWAVLITVLPVPVPLLFFGYICRSIYNTRRNKKQENTLQTVNSPTAPPSTRVSLPSDTAAHAPNFLSPSTADPTEVTVLLEN